MPKRSTDRATLNVSLSARQRRLVDEVVCSGEFVSASEVVRESLRVWETQRSERTRGIAWLRSEIETGLDAAAHGDVADADVVFEALRRKIEAGAKPTGRRKRA